MCILYNMLFYLSCIKKSLFFPGNSCGVLPGETTSWNSYENKKLIQAKSCNLWQFQQEIIAFSQRMVPYVYRKWAVSYRHKTYYSHWVPSVPAYKFLLHDWILHSPQEIWPTLILVWWKDPQMLGLCWVAAWKQLSVVSWFSSKMCSFHNHETSDPLTTTENQLH